MNRSYYIILITILLAVSSHAFAEDLDAKIQLQSNSTKGNAFDKQLPKVVISGFNRNNIFQLHQTIDLKNYDISKAKKHIGERVTSLGNSEFSLAIYANGEMLAFEDNKLMSNAILNWNKTEKISLEEAMRIANNFLESEIRPLLSIGTNEQIVPFHVLYSRYGEGSDDRPAKEEIVAYNIIYSRTIDGVHVIGAGSKIRITVGVDGKILGYRYDWPKVESIENIHTISKSNFEVREKQICKKISPDCDDFKSVDRFECGIYDPGALQRYDHGVNVIQPACYVSRKSSSDNSQSYTYFVPISDIDKIVQDKGWLEAQMIINN